MTETSPRPRETPWRGREGLALFECDRGRFLLEEAGELGLSTHGSACRMESRPLMLSGMSVPSHTGRQGGQGLGQSPWQRGAGAAEQEQGLVTICHGKSPLQDQQPQMPQEKAGVIILRTLSFATHKHVMAMR